MEGGVRVGQGRKHFKRSCTVQLLGRDWIPGGSGQHIVIAQLTADGLGCQLVPGNVPVAT